MKTQTVYILLIFLLASPIVQGGLSETGEGIIANGMEKFFVKIGDSCFDMSMQMQGETLGDSNVSTAIFQMSTMSFDPFKSDVVKDKQKTCALIFLVVGVILILVYGIQAIVAHYRPQAMQSMNYISGQSNVTPIPELIIKILKIYGVVLFIDFIILMALMANFVLCSLIMVDVANHITLAPDNVLFYCCFGIMYFVMNMFFLYRTMIICIVAAYGLLIGALYLIEATKWLAVSIFSYFIVMTFMQFIIAAICGIVIPLIESGYELIPGGILVDYGPGGVVYIVAYFVLLAVIFAVGVVCVLSPIIVILMYMLFRKTVHRLL